MISIQKRTVSRTGKAFFGWYLGRGYVWDSVTVKREVWCVMDGSKVMAECRSESIAKRIANAINSTGATNERNQ